MRPGAPPGFFSGCAGPSMDYLGVCNCTFCTHVLNETQTLKQFNLFRKFQWFTIQEIDLAQNNHTTFPDQLFELKLLRKLDVSFNKISKVEFEDGAFDALETLNLSSNDLEKLPDGLVSCLKLQKLYASYNRLKFEG